MRKNRHI